MDVDEHSFQISTLFSQHVCFALALLVLLPANLAISAEGGLRAQPSSGVGSVKIKDSEGRFLPAPCRAGPNDYIYVEVINHSDWLEQEKKTPDEPLVLYLDGEALPTLRAVFYNEWEQEVVEGAATKKISKTNRISSFGVRLEQNKANKEIWKKLVRSPGLTFERPVEVSVGSIDGRKMPSWVYPMPELEKSPFFLVILSKPKLCFGAFVIIAAFLAFLLLARNTDILRDPNLPLRPDGSKPFSLSRAQMAFWFFLVIGSFFFLWLLSGDTDTLNSSTIMLIGISAGTAVSSAFIEAGRLRDPYEKVVAKSRLAKPPEALLRELESDLRKTEEEIREFHEAMDAPARKGHPDPEDNERQKARLNKKKGLLEQQIGFFRSPRWATAMLDLLGENGVTSFHQFQMCVWTIVLGIIFVTDVYTKLAMPEFSATLLGLMGVSAGTFIGFKIPEPARA